MDRYFLEAGAFSLRDLAESLSADLRQSIGADDARHIRIVQVADDPLYRVRIGPFSDRSRAARLQALLTFHRGAVPPIIEE